MTRPTESTLRRQAREYRQLFRPNRWWWKPGTLEFWIGMLGAALALPAVLGWLENVEPSTRDVQFWIWTALASAPFLMVMAARDLLAQRRDADAVKRVSKAVNLSPDTPLVELRRRVLMHLFSREPHEFIGLAEQLEMHRGLALRLGLRSSKKMDRWARLIYDADSKNRLVTLGVAVVATIVVAFGSKSGLTLADLMDSVFSTGFVQFYLLALFLSLMFFGIVVGLRTLMSEVAERYELVADPDADLTYLMKDLVTCYQLPWDSELLYTAPVGSEPTGRVRAHNAVQDAPAAMSSSLVEIRLDDQDNGNTLAQRDSVEQERPVLEFALHETDPDHALRASAMTSRPQPQLQGKSETGERDAHAL